MFLRLTTIKFNPNNLDKIKKIYNSKKVSGILIKQEGYKFHYFCELKNKTDEALSIIAWDSKENLEKYEQNGVYNGLINNFKGYFTEKPVIKNYKVRV